ncbi:MAG TPA: SIMPL domain-containing protein, partial [Hyphomonadaceae bacterium]
MKRVLICLAIAGCAIAPAWAQEVDSTRVVRPYWWDQPVVEGLGRAMVEVEPNRANFTVAFVDTDGSSSKAMEISVARAKLAHEAVKKVAGDKARVKTSVNVVPYYEQYRDRDGNLQTNTREDKVKGYEATATLTVVLYDIALAGRARAAALALGPQDSGQMNIYLEQTIEMQREAIKVAAADARARAEAAAIAAG